MGKMKNKNGISLIVLVITILVMIILAGVVVVTMSENNPINKAKEANFKSDIATFQEDLSMHIANKLAMDSALKVTDIDAKGYDAIKKVVNSFTKKYENKIEVVDGKIVYVGTDKDELAWAGGAGVTSKAGMVNAPILSSGMIPVKYNGTKWEICDSKDPSWYNYENKQWANVMLSDGKYKAATPGTVVEDADLGSMFVWIPRFAYSINEYKVEKNVEGTTANIMDVSFLVGTSNVDVNGISYNQDYNYADVQIGKTTPKIVHPAFKNNTGIWVAKFEASMLEENLNTEANNNVSNKTIKILPSKNSWRNISVGNAFKASLNMSNQGNIYGLTTEKSHLMNNTEWGAVAYLSSSKYGFVPTVNNVATSLGGEKYTVLTAGGDYKANKTQSTTGNETGIYDLNGTSWEYLAAYWECDSADLQTYGTSEVFNNGKVNSMYASLWDEYAISPEEKTEYANGIWSKGVEANQTRKNLTKKRLELMKAKKGDALYEIILENRFSYFGIQDGASYNWIKDINSAYHQYESCVYNSDFALIGHGKIAFLVRGGFWKSSTNGGIFAHNQDFGYACEYHSFRPVIVNN